MLLATKLSVIVVSMGAMAAGTEWVAPAQPSVPYVPGFGNDAVPSGSFDYSMGGAGAPPMATADSRGVRVGTNIDPGAAAQGLPSSKMGNNPGSSNSTNARTGIQGGIMLPAMPDPGVQIGAGNMSPILEDPYGQAADSILSAEAIVPDAPAGVLESPDGQPSQD